LLFGVVFYMWFCNGKINALKKMSKSVIIIMKKACLLYYGLFQISA